MANFCIKQCIAQAADRHSHRNDIARFIESAVIEDDRADTFMLDIFDDAFDKCIETAAQIACVGCRVALALVAWMILWILRIAKLLKQLELLCRHHR